MQHDGCRLGPAHQLTKKSENMCCKGLGDRGQAAGMSRKGLEHLRAPWLMKKCPLFTEPPSDANKIGHESTNSGASMSERWSEKCLAGAHSPLPPFTRRRMLNLHGGYDIGGRCSCGSVLGPIATTAGEGQWTVFGSRRRVIRCQPHRASGRSRPYARPQGRQARVIFAGSCVHPAHSDALQERA